MDGKILDSLKAKVEDAAERLAHHFDSAWVFALYNDRDGEAYHSFHRGSGCVYTAESMASEWLSGDEGRRTADPSERPVERKLDAMIEAEVERLGEDFAAVQVLASRCVAHETLFAAHGSGNLYSRRGVVESWVNTTSISVGSDDDEDDDDA